MINTHELTDQLTKLEADINNKRYELDSCKGRLQIAYEYYELAAARVLTANKNIDDLQIEYFRLVQDIQKLIKSMKYKVGDFEREILNLESS